MPEPPRYASALDEAIGLRLEGFADDGDALLILDPTPVTAGDADRSFMHGGALATCIDTAGWYAVVNARPGRYVVVDLRTDYVRPAACVAHRVRAHCIRAGRTLALADTTIHAVDDERPVCLGRAVFLRLGD